MFVFEVENNKAVIVTGGDDSSLFAVLLEISSSSHIVCLDSIKKITSHSSSIRGLTGILIEKEFFSWAMDFFFAIVLIF